MSDPVTLRTSSTEGGPGVPRGSVSGPATGRTSQCTPRSRCVSDPGSLPVKRWTSGRRRDDPVTDRGSTRVHTPCPVPFHHHQCAGNPFPVTPGPGVGFVSPFVAKVSVLRQHVLLPLCVCRGSQCFRWGPGVPTGDTPREGRDGSAHRLVSPPGPVTSREGSRVVVSRLPSVEGTISCSSLPSRPRP